MSQGFVPEGGGGVVMDETDTCIMYSCKLQCTLGYAIIWCILQGVYSRSGRLGPLVKLANAWFTEA